GMPALGLTDHGVMNGAVDHYKACRAAGIKPILGLEAYLVDDHRSADRRSERNHLTLLAASDEGFRNLVKLSSSGFLDGFGRGKANVDMAMLERHSEGVIALTGCLQSRFCRRLVEDRPADARAHVDDLIQAFGPEQVYFEVQRNGVAEQDKANEGIVRIARELGRPLVATADVHYLRREDYDSHAALLCVQSASTLDDPNRFKFDADEFYLKTAAEMRGLFVEYPEACDNTLLVAERANVEIEFGKPELPAFPVPAGHDEDSYLRELTLEGAKDRYGQSPALHVLERIEYELGVIKDMGFSAYFLVVWDLVRYARSRGIRVGPGRGSAAGSCVAYCLRVVDVDPIRYDLLFERFLNPGRKQMPDIDMDFDERYRGEIIKYAAQRYGWDRVAQVVTFST
ncbi:MAG: DNA polymerase III subunit alpha, partial [Gaiellaceae bacterium]